MKGVDEHDKTPKIEIKMNNSPEIKLVDGGF
jgi:hypothetical protein